MAGWLYVLFFLSGAAALVYEVLWVRSLGLVFGGSHLAVTTVLAVFMGGLALGGWLIGRAVDRHARPLRLYGLLELGIALSALGFAALVRLYPVLFVPLARLSEANPLWLSALRVVFAGAAMIVPTTLMGGTLPVLSRLAASRTGTLGGQLALLYGLNTLGAVTGTLLAGFVLLERLGARGTLWVAVAANAVIGLVALALAARPSGPAPAPRAAALAPVDAAAGADAEIAPRLALWGIGISGFCALGYEVLWTRVLCMVVGTSVFSFTIMLAAFLSGIALGSHAWVLLPRRVRAPEAGWRAPALTFAAIQALIGLAALATTYFLRALPLHAMQLQRALVPESGEFAARQGTSFLLSFGLMVVPAFFMGLAFPLAGVLHAAGRGAVGGAVGAVLAANTVGAILGAAGSGFVLIYLLGIERALEALSAVNGILALAVAAGCLGRARRRRALAAVAAAAGLAGLAVALAPERFGIWDRKFFAVFRNNQRGTFDTPERIRDALENTDVLYYREGINETISVIRPRASAQAFVVNGRSEATTHPEDVQCQRTLGHLPMLVHPRPRRVFVLGLGTGMTLGATSIHPDVEQVTLAEIEAGVFGAARTFGEFNHHVLDSPKLRVVHDDGRNFLRTTRETFDVITADPIHPWSGGASYLYTVEYFRAAAARLSPGGVTCQWLPIYELTPADVRSVVRTFAESFRHVALWLTYYDAELLGSDAPLAFDEEALARRLADPRIAADLAAVDMGTPRDFLSYMLAGDAGVRAFARGGALNTDDNLRLEFSAPRSQGIPELMAVNVEALAAHRESPLAYLVPAADPRAAAEREAFWRRTDAAAGAYHRAHVLVLARRLGDPELARLIAAVRTTAPDHAPTRFLQARLAAFAAATPRPIDAARFRVGDPGGRTGVLEITAVVMRVGTDRGVVMFVDNAARDVYGQRYEDAPDAELDARLAAIAGHVLGGLRGEYDAAGRAAASRGAAVPDRETTAARLRGRIAELIAAAPAR